MMCKIKGQSIPEFKDNGWDNNKDGPGSADGTVFGPVRHVLYVFKCLAFAFY